MILAALLSSITASTLAHLLHRAYKVQNSRQNMFYIVQYCARATFVVVQHYRYGSSKVSRQVHVQMSLHFNLAFSEGMHYYTLNDYNLSYLHGYVLNKLAVDEY